MVDDADEDEHDDEDDEDAVEAADAVCDVNQLSPLAIADAVHVILLVPCIANRCSAQTATCVAINGDMVAALYVDGFQVVFHRREPACLACARTTRSAWATGGHEPSERCKEISSWYQSAVESPDPSLCSWCVRGMG